VSSCSWLELPSFSSGYLFEVYSPSEHSEAVGI